MATNNAINSGLSGSTGTGAVVGSNSPALVTPAIGVATATSLNIGASTTISGVIDDDTMATATATNVSTSESIKAYVDSSSSGFSWTEVVGTSSAIAVNNAYITNNAGLVTMTLPATAAVGETFAIVGKGAGGWLIAQNAAQILQVGSDASTTGAGGSVASTNQYDSIEFVCVTANTLFVTLGGPQGVLTIV